MRNILLLGVLFFNPLNIKALCFDLMLRHEIRVDDVGVYLATYTSERGGDNFNTGFTDTSAQRAILKAIIHKSENNG